MKNKLLSAFLALVMMLSVLPANMTAAHAREAQNYAITFAPGDLCQFTGEGPYATTAYDGSGEFLLPDPSLVYLVGRMEDLIFAGWVVEGTFAPVYAAGENVADIITGDMTFLANFEEAPTSGTVTYTISPGELTNSTTNRPQKIGSIPEEYVTETSLPATNEMLENAYGWVIPENYTFGHWENNQHEVIPVAGDFTVPFIPKNGQTYTAVWTSKYSLSVTLNPGSIDGKPVNLQPVSSGGFAVGSAYYGPGENPFPDQVIDGEVYRAAGWSYTNGGEAIIFDKPITLTEDLTLYAVWENLGISHFWNVTLEPGVGASFQAYVGGYYYIDSVLINRVYHNVNGVATVRLPSASDAFAVMPAGKTFGGWKDNNTGVIYGGNTLADISADTTFTAMWVDVPNA